MKIGFIKFIDKNGRYFWYSLNIEAEDRVVHRSEIKMEAMVGNEV